MMEQTQSLTEPNAWAMLSHIPADDRDTWLKVGMAVHAELGDTGFALWDEWSQKADSYNARDARAVWRSFKPGAIGAGTLVYLAKSHGWRPESPSKPVFPVPRPKPAPKPVKSNTGRYAAELWLSADPWTVGTHPYAITKGITWSGGAARGQASGRVIGKDADCVIVPIRNVESGKVQGVQCINSEGAKQTFGPIKGGCLLLGNTLDLTLTWYVCEGWASAVSMVFHHQNGHGVCAAAFGKSNLESVAQLLADIHKPERIVILQEVDV